MKIKIDGVGTVNVGDEFGDMSPEEQSSFVAHIHEQAIAGKKSGIPAAPVSTTEDVLRSGGAGLARGAAGLPGVPGDIQQLAKMAPWAPKRSMMDALLEKAGMDHLPTSEETTQAASRAIAGPKNLSNLVTGEDPKSFMDYQPQTKAGEYAKTAGEFIPGAMVGEGGLVRNAIRYGAIPGATAQAAGDFTKGSELEPYGKAVGGVLGSLAGPKLANLPGRIVSPITQRPDLAASVNLLESEGIPLTAGQRTGSKSLRWAESAAADMPFSSKSAADIQADQGQALNRAFTKRMGYEAPLMNDAEWQAAKDRLSGPSGKYEQLAANNTMQMDQQFLGDVGSELSKYISRVTPSNRDPYITKVVKDIGDIRLSSGQMPGHQYQALRSDVSDAAQTASNARDKNALTGIRKALDSAMERSIRPQDQGEWANANREYSALKALERAGKGAGESAALGYLSPALVRSEIAKKNGSAFLTGKNDLGNIAQAAEAAMKPMANSGTAPRAFYQKLFTPGAGAAIGGALGNIPGAIAGAAVPIMAGRALMSRPMQTYLGNQAATRLGLLSKPTTNQQKAVGLLNALYGSSLE
jgi:hypothetical protein